ncbi:MAG TPA: IS110 family transposase [Burkholderiaceae bacterium]|nr:IS110 family transposase [Burkholderiaceae bacterium]
MSKLTPVFVGLDVSKKWIQVAVQTGTDSYVDWEVRHEAKAIARMVGRLRKEAGDRPIQTCYEAGVCGYALQRTLRAAGLDCIVIAPSLIPTKPGERIKTDRRDARKLAHYLSQGDLTEVFPPTPEQEGARALFRARSTAQKDLERQRHRLSKFLLGHGRVHRGTRAWTKGHRTWLDAQRFEEELTQIAFEAMHRAVKETEQRVADLDQKLEAVAKRAPFAEPIGYLRCLRGFDTVTALGVVTELYGFLRFASARGLMAYLGLVPSEHSTGGPDQHQRGGITKTGNGHVRRLLNQAAWNYRHKPRVGKALKARRAGQPEWVIGVADQAMKRLHQRYWHLVNRGKPTPKAAIAVERELVGFVWSVLYRHAQDQLGRAGDGLQPAA